MATPRLSSTSSPARPPSIPNYSSHNGHARKHNGHVVPSYDSQEYGAENGLDRKKTTKPPANVTASLLQPRVAVALDVPPRWQRTLSICRLLSMAPCGWWGIRIVLRFLVAQVLRYRNGHELDEEASLKITEASLAGIWCLASAYLSFFFLDCLMSRWLVNYTPQATVVRLLTVSCTFGYATSWIVSVTGGDRDPCLLLPAWICIATILTTCYHYTQRKILIRKETFASMSVFSIASFISMVALLVHNNTVAAPTWPDKEHVPLVAIAKKAAEIAARVAVKVLGVIEDGSAGGDVGRGEKR
ncbi:N-glycosylation protein-domain-containing protein [Xylariaceae sp. FL0594]|nr:N-glycosylation protein-domain-containing protein [Xylariaceae sp. FL0594]